MARPVDSLSSNSTGLLAAVETQSGVVPANAAWLYKEPNSYDDFGAELNLVARNPINASRQRKKGTVVGLSASGGYNSDLTATNLLSDIEGFMFADARHKSRLDGTSTAVDGYPVAAGGLAYTPGTLIFVTGSTIPANNGLKKVTGAAAANKINVTGQGLVAGGGPVVIKRAGIEFAAGDASIDASGPLPVLASAAVGLGTLGLIPGEVVFLGGDGAAFGFANAANAGYCRILSVGAAGIVFDKTDTDFATDTGAGKTVRLFFGSVVKNELPALQKMRTYSLRRLLGAPDLDAPAVQQSEVLTGAVANELKLNFATEDKITADLSYIARDYKLYANDADIGGTLVDVEESDAINTSSDTVRSTMFVYPAGGNDSSPKALFAAFSEFDITINNNVSDNKAIGRIGSFAIIPGQFEVSGSFTAYFAGVDSVRAVRENSDVTFMVAMWKGYSGVVVDVPLVALGSSGLAIEQDSPITIPLDVQAATGRKYSKDMDHTLLFVFFPYLPRLAGPA